MNDLQNKLGYQFTHKQLLQQALTHRSYSAAHNERLEYLGDSVLSLSIATQLFSLLPQASEGDLSRIRAHLVRESTLHQLALKLELNRYLYLGEGEKHSGGATRPSILADALEAVIGAIYLDGGFLCAAHFIGEIFKTLLESPVSEMINWGKDAKTALQEWLQGQHLPLPRYSIINTQGALHDQTFEVDCILPAPLSVHTVGKGSSRRVAEQAAAQEALKQIQMQNFPKRAIKRRKI